MIDSQLQDALFDFQRTSGVVATIKGSRPARAQELADALSGAKKIVVCTIQTFPFALEKVRELAATKGKRFAVIADEAHSSQSGQAAAQLRSLLSPDELAEMADGGEVSTEDILASQMAARAADQGITFVAYTATPKAKTIELFGTRPDPKRKPASDNVPKPFHVYSMRQAIEEKFILDVLENYTPYSLAFKLAHQGEELDEKAVERSAALKGIMRWVRLHPYNISQKVEIVVEHYREYVSPLLRGRAKAMVVVGSRIEAVRWQLAIEKYIASRGYKIRTLVAFSGEVNDKESGPEPFTENSKELNPQLNGRDIREAFKGDDYQILLVANKFQTGFDQPLLCGMYVDKRLAGIQAVQTLSRLNRAHPGKDTTYVLDFVNDTAEILASFKAYHTTAELTTTTDPNLVFNLRAKLDAAGHYDDFEVDRVVAVELDPASKQSDLVGALEPVQDRILKRYKAAQEAHAAATARSDAKAAEAAKAEQNALILFKADMGAYLRLYTFLSQIFDYGNTQIEKRAIFLQAAPASPRIRTRTRRHRPLEGGLDPPQPQEPREAHAATRRRRNAQARPHYGGRQRKRPGAGEGLPARDHREGERPLRRRTHRAGQARLRERRAKGEASRIGDAPETGRKQHQGTVRQLSGPEHGDPERHHGSLGCAQSDEHSGAQLSGCPARFEGHPAQLRRPLRSASG